MTPVSESAYAVALQRFCDAVRRGDTDVAPYWRNYVGGHCNALQSTFSATHALLGTEVFGALARVYLRHAPPLDWDLNHYGSGFPDLIGAQAEGSRAAAFDWPWLGALAAVEYAITCAYYAEDTAARYYCEEIASDRALSASGALAGRYPFADIAEDLTLNSSVTVQRRGLRVSVTNRSAALSRPAS